MARIFQIALEEVVEQTTAVTPPVDESELNKVPEELKDERIALEITEKEDEVSREEELVEGLEALKMIAGKIGTPSAMEVALFRVAANMAVAGTDKSAKDFLPAMESKKEIDPKSFDEKIKAIKGKIAVLYEEINILKAKQKASKK